MRGWSFVLAIKAKRSSSTLDRDRLHFGCHTVFERIQFLNLPDAMPFRMGNHPNLRRSKMEQGTKWVIADTPVAHHGAAMVARGCVGVVAIRHAGAFIGGRSVEFRLEPGNPLPRFSLCGIGGIIDAKVRTGPSPLAAFTAAPLPSVGVSPVRPAHQKHAFRTVRMVQYPFDMVFHKARHAFHIDHAAMTSSSSVMPPGGSRSA